MLDARRVSIVFPTALSIAFSGSIARLFSSYDSTLSPSEIYEYPSFLISFLKTGYSKATIGLFAKTASIN